MVRKQTLLLLAGIVWLIAGLNVLTVGINTWLATEMEWYLKTGFAILTFSIFFFLIFQPLYKKYTARILSFEDKNHIFSFFDVKGWLIMAFMITLGVNIRKFSLLPNTFITPFYTGLSIALSLTGFHFIKEWIIRLKK